MFDAESEMQDLFIHRQHSQDGRFSEPKKPQCSGGYRVRDNDIGITLQPHFSGPQERLGSIQDHRLQLKIHIQMRIKQSLDNSKYFLVGFTSGSVLDTSKFLIGFQTFINFRWLAPYVGNFRTMNQISRLLKCGYYAFKLLVCKQLHGNGLPLTTNSAIINLTNIALLRKEIQHDGCANSHRLRDATCPPFLRALDLHREQPADRRNNTRHKEEL